MLITGGAGYLGTELVRALARAPEVDEVVVYDNLSRRNYNLMLGPPLSEGRDTRIRLVVADVLDTRRLRAALDGVDVVIHLAARVTTPFAEGDFHALEQVNHWGTAELSYALEERRGSVRRLIHLSSTAVYGQSEGEATLDTAPTPATAYGISKLRGERMVERLGSDLDLFLVRCGNIYGYSRSLRFDAVINRFLLDAHLGRRITVEGSGEQRRAFVHVDRAAAAISRMALGELEPGRFHLLDRNLSVLEIRDALLQLYPDLESLYIAQDLPRRSLIVAPDPRLAGPLPPLAEELAAFRTHFSFD